MAYNEHAAVRRHCTATRRDGQPCQGWALWDDTEDGRQVCGIHAGRHHRGPQRLWNEQCGYVHAPRRHAHYQPCTCLAYDWPHRPGGGLCRWPDPPERRCPTPAGTRHWAYRVRMRR
jgi:hypothetical protein